MLLQGKIVGTVSVQQQKNDKTEPAVAMRDALGSMVTVQS